MKSERTPPLEANRVPYPIPEWEVEAKRLLRAEMARKGVNFKRLEKALGQMGIVESSAQLNRKIGRAKFSAGFLFACLAAIGITDVRIPPPPETSKPARED